MSNENGSTDAVRSSLFKAGSSNNVPRWKKVAYAVGAMPYAMCTTLINLYFSIFLLEVVLLDPIYVLAILFSGRVWDAITDPMVGYLTSLTKTRFGRLRPWMAMVTLPAGLFYFLLWFSYVDHWPDYCKLFYYMFCYLIFNSLLTCLHVPYISLTMHMSEDSQQRDSITSYRVGFELFSTLLGVGIYTFFFVILVHSSSSSDCDAGGERLVDPKLKAAYQWHSVVVAAIVVACVSITVIFIKESEDEIGKNKRVGFIQGLRETLGFKPYRYLLLVNVFSWLGFQFIQGNIALYVKYSVGLENQYVYVIAVVLVSAILWTIFWQLFISKFGKKTGMYLAMWITLPTLITFLYGNYIKLGSYPVAVILSMGLSASYLITWSMLPDVINEAAVHSSVRREEMFCAFFVFGNKLAGGLTLAFSTGLYKVAGYDENACDQTWEVKLTLKLLVTVPPVLFILISLVFLWHYPITKSTIENTAKLVAKKRSSSVDDMKSVILKEKN